MDQELIDDQKFQQKIERKRFFDGIVLIIDHDELKDDEIVLFEMTYPVL
jgi:hypothetical protein